MSIEQLRVCLLYALPGWWDPASLVPSDVVDIREPTLPGTCVRVYRLYPRVSEIALTPESNWLRGGKVLASHTSEDNGVVTSLAMDNNYLIIGMANSHIHVFDAITGAFRKSLTGHTGGVWTLVMVSGCSGDDAAPFLSAAGASGSGATRSTSSGASAGGGGAGASSGGRGKFGMPGRRASFAAAAAGLLTGGSATRSATASNANANAGTGGSTTTSARTVLSFMGQEEVPDPGPRPPRSADGAQDDGDYGETADDADDIEDLGPQSDVCNAAQGFGNERAVVVSGGCDRMVKVWDIQTG